MNEILNELEGLLVNLNHPIIDEFGIPESKSEIIGILERTKFTPNDEIVQLFLWKNGLKLADYLRRNGDIMELCSFGSFFAIKDLLSYYLLKLSTETLYHKKFFPIFFSNEGDHVLIDLYSKSKTYGKLFLFAPSITLSSEPMGIFDSLELMIKTIFLSYKNQIYQLNEDGTLKVEYEKESKIARELNPDSEFWIKEE